jgi:hypothetical protein
MNKNRSMLMKTQGCSGGIGLALVKECCGLRVAIPGTGDGRLMM